jgi:hypothetical protein
MTFCLARRRRGAGVGCRHGAVFPSGRKSKDVPLFLCIIIPATHLRDTFSGTNRGIFTTHQSSVTLLLAPSPIPSFNHNAMKLPGPPSITRALRMKTKYCLSFLKKDWTLRDYPIRVRNQGDAPADPGSRFKTYPWSAQIDGWGVISGLGNTRDEALEALAASFEKQRSERLAKAESLPRPGTQVPIQFASTKRIEAHAALADDFIHRVLELPWAFISDETELWHFHTNDSNDKYVSRISEIYGIDCSDLADAPIADILDRIAAHEHIQQK